MCSISTNILTVLANFLGIIIHPFLKSIGCDRGNTTSGLAVRYPSNSFWHVRILCEVDIKLLLSAQRSWIMMATLRIYGVSNGLPIIWLIGPWQRTYYQRMGWHLLFWLPPNWPHSLFPHMETNSRHSSQDNYDAIILHFWNDGQFTSLGWWNDHSGCCSDFKSMISFVWMWRASW